jgi:hypothetical protein
MRASLLLGQQPVLRREALAFAIESEKDAILYYFRDEEDPGVADTRRPRCEQ